MNLELLEINVQLIPKQDHPLSFVYRTKHSNACNHYNLYRVFDDNYTNSGFIFFNASGRLQLEDAISICNGRSFAFSDGFNPNAFFSMAFTLKEEQLKHLVAGEVKKLKDVLFEDSKED